MAEAQLAGRAAEGSVPSSPSSLDLAWQEMLNHATNKVRINIQYRYTVEPPLKDTFSEKTSFCTINRQLVTNLVLATCMYVE